MASAPELRPPGGLFHTTDWVPVEDADEEIMDLYMGQTNAGEGGLGFLDASKPELELTLELLPPSVASAADTIVVPGKRRARRPAVKGRVLEPVSVDLRVVQDPSSLRSRSGDTGSVLWRSSLHLARQILTQHYFPPSEPLLDPAALSSARVLELGAGTGVLASLLAPLCSSYIATDREENLRLVRRNVEGNAGAVKRVSGDSGGVATVEALDWADVSAARRRAVARGRRHELDHEVDLVLAVDCIYNEHLVAPLVDTLSVACAQGALAWVVVELRSNDVLELFLDTWLKDPAGWTVLRLGEDAMGLWDHGARGNWVGWVGWVKRDEE